jgi:hypothetical protein
MNPNPLLALNHFTVPCSLTDVLTFLLSYLCFSTASSRKAKEAASWNLQPLQTNLKVLQEQQTQAKHSMLFRSPLANFPTEAARTNFSARPQRTTVVKNEFAPARRFFLDRL